MKNAHGTAGPVTVVIARVVQPGREREYEEWLAGIAEQMSAFEPRPSTRRRAPEWSARPDS